MGRKEILEQLNAIFIDILDNEGIKLTESTTAADIEEWDSLTHIHLIVSFEKHFKIRFASKEIQSWKHIGDMIESISEKI